MSFSWKESAEGNNEKMPEGYHKLTCTKVMRFNKDGGEYTSKDGTPQVLTVLANDDKESMVQMFTLSDKAAWKLAQFLKYAGADIERMDAEGVTPDKFQDEDFAKAQLEGRQVYAVVKHKGQYANAEFLTADDLPAHELKRLGATSAEPVPAGGVDEADIPF